MKRVLTSHGQILILGQPHSRSTDVIDPISVYNLGPGHLIVTRIGFAPDKMSQRRRQLQDVYKPVAPGQEVVVLDREIYQQWVSELRPNERADFDTTMVMAEPKGNNNVAILEFVAEAITPNGPTSTETTVLISVEDGVLRVFPR
ncbi:hypothetical protein Mterra_01487 [Calidithermus terrae]|uniref:Uncharacterized protein n=1 Tax=Calidithermus terrae TaxID=1408545 RepID=A0A399EQL0_9DEIN|nr:MULTISPECIES: hypothetical protein [Calidithermus]RIH86238.1 hypothetical protein Mterra_01487 [Calidithermus terrae]